MARNVHPPIVDPEVFRDEHIPAIYISIRAELLASHLRDQEKGFPIALEGRVHSCQGGYHQPSRKAFSNHSGHVGFSLSASFTITLLRYSEKFL